MTSFATVGGAEKPSLQDPLPNRGCLLSLLQIKSGLKAHLISPVSISRAYKPG